MAERKLRRSTKADWLERAPPGGPQPVRYANPTPPAPAKVQAAVRQANEAGVRVVPADEFRRTFARPARILVRRPRRLDRRLGCGRPAPRRSRSTAARGDPDLDEPPRPR